MRRAPACGALVRSAFPTNCDTAAPGCYIDPARYQNGEDCGPNVNGGPVFWPDAGADFGLVLQMAGRDFLKSFRYDPRARRLDPRPFAVSPVRAVEGMSGGFATLSADGGRNAILWVSTPLGDPQWQNVPGRLAAFDPLTLRELWHDDGGELFAKFTPPTIADGRVVRATLSGRIVVYGLLAQPPRGLVPRIASSIAAFFRPRPFVPPPLVGRAAVDEKYRLAGGETGFLGAPAFDARPVQDRAQGWYRDFHGVIVGAVPATISARHLPPGTPPAPGHRPWSGLGTPFASSIYWSAATGAHILTAEIRDAWLATGGPTGPLGYPTGDEAPAGDGGRAAQFQSGRIEWTAAHRRARRPLTRSAGASRAMRSGNGGDAPVSGHASASPGERSTSCARGTSRDSAAAAACTPAAAPGPADSTSETAASSRGGSRSAAPVATTSPSGTPPGRLSRVNTSSARSTTRKWGRPLRARSSLNAASSWATKPG